MVNAEIFIAEREYPDWKDVIDCLKKAGKVVLLTREKAEVSLVLGGKYLNPCVLSGKKKLFYDIIKWGWQIGTFVPIAKHYYNELHDLTGLSDKQKADFILKCC